MYKHAPKISIKITLYFQLRSISESSIKPSFYFHSIHLISISASNKHSNKQRCCSHYAAVTIPGRGNSEQVKKSIQLIIIKQANIINLLSVSNIKTLKCVWSGMLVLASWLANVNVTAYMWVWWTGGVIRSMPLTNFNELNAQSEVSFFIPNLEHVFSVY